MTLEDLIGRVFDRTWRAPLLSTFTLEEPPVDMYQENGMIVVKAAIPGAKLEEISVSLDGDVLTLRREARAEKEEQEKDYYKEQQCSSFVRRIPLPEPVDSGKAEAELKDGMLIIMLPRSAQAATKQIPIK